MKLLWVKSDFLHPTTRGGQIRTLEMLRRLAERHEVHYVAFDDPGEPEGLARSEEYCAKAYPIRHSPPRKGSAGFYGQVLANLASSVPAVIARQASAAMSRTVGELMARGGFDSVVCDFLTPSINIPDLGPAALFQHNVETRIWQRRAEHAGNFWEKAYLQLQAKRMFAYERRVCRQVRRVIAVSRADAEAMESMFGLEAVPHVATGVDVEGMAPPAERPAPRCDLVFVGSMDWSPNIDAVERFAREILPLIRRQKPDCTLAVVGRTPPRSIQLLGDEDPRITVTGTVPDVRPYLWNSKVSIVPLRVGGGTRLKIYEAMAAGAATVSTTVGAEGLDVNHPRDIRIADSTEAFAAECLALLSNDAEREQVARAARDLVARNFSWRRVADDFEAMLR